MRATIIMLVILFLIARLSSNTLGAKIFPNTEKIIPKPIYLQDKISILNSSSYTYGMIYANQSGMVQESDKQPGLNAQTFVCDILSEAFSNNQTKGNQINGLNTLNLSQINKQYAYQYEVVSIEDSALATGSTSTSINFKIESLKRKVQLKIEISYRIHLYTDSNEYTVQSWLIFTYYDGSSNDIIFYRFENASNGNLVDQEENITHILTVPSGAIGHIQIRTSGSSTCLNAASVHGLGFVNSHLDSKMEIL
jgi:hypothetical protein